MQVRCTDSRSLSGVLGSGFPYHEVARILRRHKRAVVVAVSVDADVCPVRSQLVVVRSAHRLSGDGRRYRSRRTQANVIPADDCIDARSQRQDSDEEDGR
jgi:hypothetical protein